MWMDGNPKGLFKCVKADSDSGTKIMSIYFNLSCLIDTINIGFVETRILKFGCQLIIPLSSNNRPKFNVLYDQSDTMFGYTVIA